MHEPVLVPDLTLFIQMGLFFASYFVLNALVFKPYLALLKARREQTFGLKEQSELEAAQAAKLEAEYQAYSLAEKKKISAWSDEQRRRVHDEERQLVAKARESASQAADAARAELADQKSQARQSLDSAVAEFSSAIVSKILGRQIDVPPAASKSRQEAANVVNP